MMRRRGPSLLGVAAVAGVAHHAGSKSAQASANEQAQNQQMADLEAQNAELAAQQQQLLAQQQAAAAPAPAPVAAAAVPSGGIDMAKLQQLADLHTAGVLTDEEFAAEKAKILAAG